MSACLADILGTVLAVPQSNRYRRSWRPDMALTLRDFVAHLFSSDPIESVDQLVAIAPVRLVRRGIPDEYLERHPPVEEPAPPEPLIADSLWAWPYDPVFGP